MKQQIDALVRNVRTDLSRPRPAENQLAGGLAAIGLDGLSMADEGRAVLARWAEDMALSAEDRHYAGQQLSALPPELPPDR